MEVLTFAPRHSHKAQPLFLFGIVNLLTALGLLIQFGRQYPLAIVWVLGSAIALSVAIANMRQARHSLVADDRGLLLLIEQTVIPIHWQQLQRLDTIPEHQALGIRLRPDAHVWQQLSNRQLRRWCQLTQQSLKLYGIASITDGLLEQPTLLQQQCYLSEQLAQSSGFHILLHQSQFDDPLIDIANKLRQARRQALEPQPPAKPAST
ncbi:hypothetical protein SAMN04488540_11787 [Ferrimonas sediminum]|uniref:DUF2982 domain-containing protein n=1 Tax=Ferrimonas sediminum TaxID=718193 RepID=A0A1G8YIF9_9GAMM|nr:hypothetical protein [Ferrimonas sediminum]SDK02622.1 hypothetical protein SAMN04488540_11787 [Ferrimonas sediminum]